MNLSSPRLVLAPPTQADLPDMLTLWTDANVVRYIGGRIFTEEECWIRLLKYVGHWRLFNFGYWLVREAATGRFVGEVGIAYQRRTIMAKHGNDPEAGWALLPWAQGKGYAREALGTILPWFERSMPAERIVCLIDPANQPSINLAHANGFRRFASTALNGAAVDLFERRRASPQQPTNKI